MGIDSDTGNGSTLVFADSGFVANYQRLGGIEQEVPEVPDSQLLTEDFETRRPGDLITPGDLEAELQYDADNPPPLRTVELATLTYPVPEGLSNGATLAGTGWIQKRNTPDLANNELQVGTLVFMFDGKTGPIFTPAS